MPIRFVLPGGPAMNAQQLWLASGYSAFISR
jgi:hypothetical protein